LEEQYFHLMYQVRLRYMWCYCHVTTHYTPRTSKS